MSTEFNQSTYNLSQYFHLLNQHFQHWIQQFILVLKDYGMESLISDNRGQLPRAPSANEQLSFDSTLSY